MEEFEKRARGRWSDLADSLGGPPRSRVRQLLQALAESRDAAADQVFRSWARTDPRGAERIRQVDRSRIEYLVGQFREVGFPEEQARFRGTLIYCWYVGQAAVGLGPEDPREQADLACQVLELLARA